MWQSMKIAAYSRAAAISTASRPSCAICAFSPRLASAARATTELISLSSAIRTSWPPSAGGALEHLERFARRARAFAHKAPRPQIVLEDRPVGRRVIDDQRAQALQLRVSPGGRDHVLDLRQPRGEPEQAAGAQARLGAYL